MKKLNKDKLQKEYTKQLAKIINHYSVCKFDYKLTRNCMFMAAYLAVKKVVKK